MRHEDSLNKWALGIDIGGTNTKYALVSKNGEVREACSFRTQPEDSFDVFRERLVAHTRDYLESQKTSLSETVIGVGVPNYSSKTELLVSPPNLSWGTFAIKKAFEEAFATHVYMENDANVAAVGERLWGSAQGLEDFAVITVGTGIGTGIYTHGQLVVGSTGQGGEGGHLIVGDENVLCSCGGLDHFEAYCSVGAMKRYMLNIHDREMRYHDIVEEFHAGQKQIQDLFQRAAKYFARGLHQIVVAFSPEKLILAGGGMAVGEAYTEMIRSEFAKIAYQPLVNSVDIIISDVSISSGAVLGAAALAFDRHHSSSTV